MACVLETECTSRLPLVMGREGAGAVKDKSAARAHQDRGHAAH